MRATVMFGPGDVRITNVPDAAINEPTDAVVNVVRACICGSDLWAYRGLEAIPEGGRRMGHEAVGVVESIGNEVHMIKRGDLVIMPFAYSDGSCTFCREGLPTSCVRGGFFGIASMNGAQAEALRVPLADEPFSSCLSAETTRRCLPCSRFQT
jgi:threonine dehydrogenase-like Zn-dependent dehydrogenase